MTKCYINLLLTNSHGKMSDIFQKVIWNFPPICSLIQKPIHIHENNINCCLLDKFLNMNPILVTNYAHDYVPFVSGNGEHSWKMLFVWDIVLTYCWAWAIWRWAAAEAMKMGFVTFLSFVLLSSECLWNQSNCLWAHFAVSGRLPIRNVSAEFVSKRFILFLKLFDWAW